jgi:RNA polymerase sigma factor (TIGR02999 family)
MGEITRILLDIENGNVIAAEQLLPLVYAELRSLAARKMTQEDPNHTLQATALVHEAYLRLVGTTGQPGWDSRGHFYAAAAEAMRRILIESARRKQRIKHGGTFQQITLDQADYQMPVTSDDLLALDEALTELEERDPQIAQLVKLRFFAGLSVEEAAVALSLSSRTAYRNWAYARAWLYRRIQGNEPLPQSNRP